MECDQSASRNSRLPDLIYVFAGDHVIVWRRRHFLLYGGDNGPCLAYFREGQVCSSVTPLNHDSWDRYRLVIGALD